MNYHPPPKEMSNPVLRDQWWENGRLHRKWFDPTSGKVVHERLDPPAHIQAHQRRLEALRDSSRERARKNDGLTQIAAFTTSERDKLIRMGVKIGDVEGLKWALKRDEFRHAKVSKDG